MANGFISEELKKVPATQYDIAHVNLSLAELKTDMKKVLTFCDKVEKQDTRIDKLENHRNYLWGVVSTIIIVIPIVIALLK